MTNRDSDKCILITGATGKVGTAFIERILADEKYSGYSIRALCHNRVLPENDRLEVVKGSIADREVAARGVAGATHVLHLATCKETPEDVMDVTVKGLFWILEEARASKTFEQFILLGGDAGMGHFFYPHPVPVTEEQGHSAYPGCYALSKVIEEVMVEQYCIQYDLNACCLRAPWIMEKDDFRFALSLGEDQFGGPPWAELIGEARAADGARKSAVPLMLSASGAPLKRNFIHVDDLVSAITAAIGNTSARQSLFNIAMNEPVDYGAVAAYLAKTRAVEAVRIPTPFHSNWLDNSKARHLLGWRPKVDFEALIERAWSYRRAPDDPRKIWYPG